MMTAIDSGITADPAAAAMDATRAPAIRERAREGERRAELSLAAQHAVRAAIVEDSLTPTWSGEALAPDPVVLRLLGAPVLVTAA